VLGTADSHRYVERAGGRPVPAGADYEVLVVGDEQGFPFLPTLDAVLTRLLARIEAGHAVRLVVPNPDLIYPTEGGGVGIASASVAGIFEGVLRLRYPERSDLVFDRLGKPHAPLFDAAIARLGTRDVLMIGDQLETDIRGACEAGLDSALVTSGVTSLARLRAARRHLPIYLLMSLEEA
jgi:ribonucleotide monophosphatase NagD (HAD superfamily)